MNIVRRFAALILLLPAVALFQTACAESVEPTPAQVVTPAPAKAPAAPQPKVVEAAKLAPVSKPAPSNVQYQAGTHYQVLPNPARTLDPNKIEVMEVFWYGCSHCFDFEPLIKAWKEGIADDVIFARTPAVWRPVMKVHANVYYAAEALDMPEELHHDIFTILGKNPRLEDQKQFAKAFAKYGVSEEKYLKTVKAFGITGKVSQAETRVRKNYMVQGTPELIVNGKYRVSGRMAGNQPGMLQVVDYLVEMERSSK